MTLKYIVTRRMEISAEQCCYTHLTYVLSGANNHRMLSGWALGVSHVSSKLCSERVSYHFSFRKKWLGLFPLSHIGHSCSSVGGLSSWKCYFAQRINIAWPNFCFSWCIDGKKKTTASSQLISYRIRSWINKRIHLLILNWSILTYGTQTFLI